MARLGRFVVEARILWTIRPTEGATRFVAATADEKKPK